MKAEPFQIGDVLKDPKRFVVPIYQRTYAWTKDRQLEKFFDSIEAKAQDRLAGGGPSYPHYMGALLLSPRGKFTFGSIPMFDVVDGQQRITTYQIFLAALRDIAKSNSFGTLADQLTTFLINADTPIMKDKKNERYKLQTTNYDRELYRDLIDLDCQALRKKYPDSFYKKGTIKDAVAPLPLRAWWFFRDEAMAFLASGEVGEEWTRLVALSSAVLEDFRVIVITLDDTDDAQVIFETLNSGGEPLAAMDLVRNDVFHRAIRRGEDPEDLMETRWKVFEDGFWKQESTQGRIRKPRIDFFLAHVLAAETGKEVLLSELYARYKAFVNNRAFQSVDEELDTLLRHTPTYRILVDPTGEDALAHLARELQAFDVTTAYPLVFVIASSNEEDNVKEDLYRLISSYIIRRALCGLTPKAYNLTFLRLVAALRTNGVSVESFAVALAESEGDTVRFPSDQDLETAILSKPQYSAMPSQRLNYILCQLERCSRDKFDETTGIRGDLNIEHVLPEKWAEHWPLPSGAISPLDFIVPADDPRRSEIELREILKHSLGNLTLLTLPNNSRLGNLPFTQHESGTGMSKREALRVSLLKMNQEIASHEEWNENHIKGRALILTERAMRLWPHPITGVKGMS